MQNKLTVIGLDLQTIIYVKILSQGSKIMKQNQDIFFESKQDGNLQWRKTVHLHFRTPKNVIFKPQNIRLKPLKRNLIYYQKYKESHNAYPNAKIFKE